MSLRPGMRIGVYEITAQLGVGGMGEVYRARDSRLDRQVALKVLPEALAADPERLARFEREAKTLAALNHPHIAQIHGLEHGAIVMELVEGEDLAQRIARGPIPMDEALPIARQIAEALEAAHAQGIVHRDLKPANIKVRPDGTVKVLDFGLAKAMATVPDGRDFSPADQSPTITSPAMTGVGMILGTAAYMSPEQAKGREADRRSDIWAFGVVVYEMLTGRRAFDGADMTDVLGAVVRLEPNWAALPTGLPPPIRTLLQSCLVKDRGRRVADISTALFVLDKAASLAAPVALVAIAPMPAQPIWRRAVAPMAAAMVASIVVGVGVWVATRLDEPAPPRVTRFQLNAPGPAALNILGSGRDLAITPDGSKVVYIGNNSTQIFVRALGALEPVAVFTGAPRSPFVSPDGQWIGFVDNLREVKKVAVTGGPAITLATTDGNSPRGATWGPDDSVFFATESRATGLQRTANGAPPAVVTRPDRANNEADHLWPEWLPGGRGLLFTITALTGGIDAAQIAVLDPQTGTHRVLIRGGSHAHYVSAIPGPPAGDLRDLSAVAAPKAEVGYLVYVAGGALRAVPFDLVRLETRGTPESVVPDVFTTSDGGVNAVFAADGTLAYVSSAGVNGRRTLVWIDRQGRETPIPAPPKDYMLPRVSSDGTRVVVIAEGDLWIWDLGRNTFTRTTLDASGNVYPVWLPDGRRLAFSSSRGGTRNLFWQAADGTGGVERLSDSPRLQNATAATPDGRQLIFTEASETTGEDLMQLTLQGTRDLTPLVQSSFSERNGTVSPDGRWLAYEANDSGRFEVFVRPYPDVNRGRWQVSTTGGGRPLWSATGHELFYVAPPGVLMQVRVERGPLWSAMAPALLFRADSLINSGGNNGRTYDIAPDGQRFLILKQAGSGQNAAPPSVIVVQNWIEELKRLVPLK